jgi:hypothetical protein
MALAIFLIAKDNGDRGTLFDEKNEQLNNIFS